MTIYKELSFENDIESVKGIQFNVMSPEEIKKRSICEILTTDTYSGSDPVISGLFDSRMGVIENDKICKTCQQKNTFCPGHFGHIELAKPVFYIQFFDTVRKILKCVCFRCSRLLIDPQNPVVVKMLNKKYSRQKRFEIVYKCCSKIKRCGQENPDGCNAKQPNKISKDNVGKISMEWKEGDETKKVCYNAEDVLMILKRITNQDGNIMGFNKNINRPEWLICTVFPVPPPSVRPSVRNDTGQRCEDDLTHKLCDIIKTNNTLKQKLEKSSKNTTSEEQIDYWWSTLLQYHVSTFVDNQLPGISPAKQRTGRPLRSLTERLKSKEGRIRGNLMGKRVDFSARSVITPDPHIDIDELGVPIKIAMNLTFPEVVNEFNIEEMKQLVLNGQDKYPGAKYIRKSDSNFRTVRLKNIDRNNLEIKLGDIIDRHLRNGDYVLFNRQPSLHKMSMMGHKVRVMPYETFRLNVCCTPSYNADYDGDEMNMHVPQSLQTQNELEQLTSVPTQIISPRVSKPIISVVQDIVLGLYRITKDDTYVSNKQYFNILARNSKFNGDFMKNTKKKKDAKIWHGREVLSSVINPLVNMDTSIKIQKGVIKSGLFKKDTYQGMTNGLVHMIYNDLGPEECKELFDNTQRLICDWLVYNGFSVGMSDLMVEKDTQKKLRKVIHELKVKVFDIIRDVHMNRFNNFSIQSNNEFFESKINEKLNEATNQINKIGTENIKDIENRMMNMINSGSKGTAINVSQMMASVGQQSVDGKRIISGFDNRTLPHFTKYDDGPESRGFVENSFIEGLSSQEFFFHAMGGREGLIDTAVKSVTGDTPIIIIENGQSKYVEIGKWIDEHIENNKENVKNYPEDKNMELLKLNEKVYIPTGDNNGNTSWGELTAVTRHDPGEVLYDITTESGRNVIVADSETLLIWNGNKFEKKHSSLVEVGEYVPTVINTPEPPIIVDYVDMTEYFPKKEYIYGTDFNKAVKMMNEAQGDKYFIPKGWWNENNGKAFTLPYTKKASLTRATSGRSCTENIHDGCVYPYHASRDTCRIPDKFELNEENGKFIGLFLADGCTDIKSGSVIITKKNEEICEFTKKWFSKMLIKYQDKTEKKNLGTTRIVRGFSSLLVRFLDKFVGKLASGKFVPDIAYNAPKEFVIGLLSGYFSGDGYVSKGGVSAGSVSKRLMDGISYLCSRIGVFGKRTITQQENNNVGTENILPMNNILIRAQWANKFSEIIDLIPDYKNEALEQINNNKNHINFEINNDVVLDKIENIVILSVDNYPKLYDVTVPSTVNFTTADGLLVLDTSETGYLQRKLIKAMEDCKVNFDMTVRNANNNIVQFKYGDDSVDAIKLEKHKLDYLDTNMTLDKMEELYLITETDNFKHILTDEVIDKFYGTDKWENKIRDHFMQIMEDREFIIINLNNRTCEDNVMAPVAIQRILVSTKMMFQLDKMKFPSDLNPLYVLERINDLIETLKSTHMMNMVIRHYLTPKKLIKNRFTKDAFDYVCDQILFKYEQSLVHPSEMVGVVAAQSLGEPATQLSTWGEGSILLGIRNKKSSEITSFYGKIKDICDNILEENKNKVKILEEYSNDELESSVLDFDKNENIEYFIIGVNENEKTRWNRISQISRHPANGKMIKTTTSSGKYTVATMSHSFLKRHNHTIIPIEGKDLKIGDRIPIAKYIPSIKNPYYIKDEFELTYNFGYICGSYIADGCISSNNTFSISKLDEGFRDFMKKYLYNIGADKITEKHKHVDKLNIKTNLKVYEREGGYDGVDTHVNFRKLSMFLSKYFKTGSYNKVIPSWVFMSNIDFIRGIVGGYFNGDGNVNYVERSEEANKRNRTKNGSGSQIRCHSVSEKLIDGMCLLLAYCGIFASKGVEKPERTVGELYVLYITPKYAKTFSEQMPFKIQYKQDALEKIIEYVEREDKHSDQEIYDKIPEVGDLVAEIGKELEMPGQSRNYGRWSRERTEKAGKEYAIGRKTLENYIELFEEQNDKLKHDYENKETLIEEHEKNRKSGERKLKITPWTHKNYENINQKINLLKQAVNSDVIWDTITDIEILDDPKEYVYDFTVPGNDSFMVDAGVLVHNTLNSVEYNTEIMVNENGKLKEYKIGDWIENRIERSDKSKNTYIEKGDQTYTPIPEDEHVTILSCDKKGQVMWDQITAVTKHLPINEDGSNTLVKITLHSGRECVVTKGESILKRINNEIVPANGADVKLGDYLIISDILPIPEECQIKEWDLSEYLSKKEYIYMSEVEKALALKDKYRWWFYNKGVNFELPYNRSDSFIDAFVGIGKKRGNKKRSNQENKPNCIYPKTNVIQPCHIPEKIELNELFGFFVGAYLAEGCCTQYHVLISNHDDDFMNKLIEWANTIGLKYHFDEGDKPKGYSRTIRFHSLLLAELFSKAFNKEITDDDPVFVNEKNEDVIDDIIESAIYDIVNEEKQSKKTVKTSSKQKTIAPELIGAPDEFLKGLIDGYFCGDGCIPKKDNYISASSVSKKLLTNIQLILHKFGIKCSVRSQKSAYKCAIRRGFQTTMPYLLYVDSNHIDNFKKNFKLTIKSKQDKLNGKTKINYSMMCEDVYSYVPDVILSKSKSGIMKYEADFITSDSKNENDIRVLQDLMNEQVFYDKVVKVEYVISNHSHVYDVTTNITKTFIGNSLICYQDTFHSAGIASASQVVRGVPRLKEILSVSKNIKTPNCTIYLKEEYNNYNKAKHVMNTIETTFMKDIAVSSHIHFEPNKEISDIDEDNLFLMAYNEYQDINIDNTCNNPSPWVLRIVLDSEKMLNKNITALDIDLVLRLYYDDKIRCLYSDDNFDKVIFRISLTDTDITDMITDLKALEYNIMEKLIITGIENIKKVSMTKMKIKMLNDDQFKVFADKEDYILSTDGTNLLSVLTNKAVDSTKTISNDIIEIYDIFGIEAARQALYVEINDIMKTGASVDYRHIELLVDVMTSKGHLLSIDRHGINRSDIGPLAKCSFEETSDILIKAGIFGEYDKINGVSANIMLGQIAKSGTGDSQLLMDETKIVDMLENIEEDDEEEESENVEELCDKLGFDFEFPN